MLAYSNCYSGIDALKSTLMINHIAPTCPDTLWCFPFTQWDPLIIEKSPHVYFACNTDKFSVDKIDMRNGSIRLLTLPKFS